MRTVTPYWHQNCPLGCLKNIPIPPSPDCTHNFYKMDLLQYNSLTWHILLIKYFIDIVQHSLSIVFVKHEEALNMRGADWTTVWCDRSGKLQRSMFWFIWIESEKHLVQLVLCAVSYEQLHVHSTRSYQGWVQSTIANMPLTFFLNRGFLRGRPELSLFFTYEITSHKGGEGVAKMYIHLITFFRHKSNHWYKIGVCSAGQCIIVHLRMIDIHTNKTPT